MTPVAVVLLLLLLFQPVNPILQAFGHAGDFISEEPTAAPAG